MLLPVPNHPH